MKSPQIPPRMTPAFAFSFVERAIQESLALRKFGNRETHEVLAFFAMADLECVYCGSRDVNRWDHVVPVSRGGETVLGNMVPACSRCDDSKQHLAFDNWMASSAQFSPKSRGIADVEERVERIRAYAEHFHYAPKQLDQRLSPSELTRLNTIRSKIRELRYDIESLISDFHKRTKSTVS